MSSSPLRDGKAAVERLQIRRHVAGARVGSRVSRGEIVGQSPCQRARGGRARRRLVITNFHAIIRLKAGRASSGHRTRPLNMPRLRTITSLANLSSFPHLQQDVRIKEKLWLISSSIQILYVSGRCSINQRYTSDESRMDEPKNLLSRRAVRARLARFTISRNHLN